VDRHPGAERTARKQHGPRGVAAEADHEPAAVGAQQPPCLRHPGDHAGHRRQLAGDADVDELRAADGIQPEAARAQQARGRAVQRSGEADVGGRIQRVPRLRERQRGVDVTGSGADDDEDATPFRHRKGTAGAVC